MTQQFELNQSFISVLDTIKKDQGFSTRQEALEFCIRKFSEEFLGSNVNIEEVDKLIEEDKKSSKILGVESIDDLF